MSGIRHPWVSNEPEPPEMTYERAIEVIEAEIGSDLVAMDVQVGQCFGFNAVAASVWRELETPKRFNELRDVLLGEYDVGDERCSTELRELLDDLVAKGLVRAEKA
jgi:hypothetical protein